MKDFTTVVTKFRRCRAIPRIPRHVLMTGGVEVTGSMMIFDRFNHKR
jgi:hypothetical protein